MEMKKNLGLALIWCTPLPLRKMTPNRNRGSILQNLQKQIAGYKLINDKIGQAYHLVDGSTKPLYHPEIFGAGFFDADLDLLLETYPISNPWDVEAKTRLDGISKLLKSSKPDIARLQLLKQTLDQIDQRRGTDWKTIFPKINNFFIENKI